MYRLLLIVLAAAFSAATNAEYFFFVDGNRLEKSARAFDRSLNGAKDTGTLVDGMAFLSYVQGVFDTWVQRDGCSVPTEAPLKQVASVVSKFVKAHPEHWSRDGSTLVRAALIKAYCKSK